MNFATNSLVGFEHQGVRHYCQVYCRLEGDLYLLVDPQGRSYIVYGWGMHGPSERDAFGRTFWPPWKPGDPVEADPEYVRGATNELLRKPGMQRALQRIVFRRDRKLAVRRDTCLGESWEIPYLLCVSHGGYTELSSYFVAYLDREPEGRSNEEAALEMLRTGQARRGSERQYEVLMACHYGTLPAAWLAKVWGINRSTVSRQLNKGLEFLATYTPVNSPRVKPHYAYRNNHPHDLVHVS